MELIPTAPKSQTGGLHRIASFCAHARDWRLLSFFSGVTDSGIRSFVPRVLDNDCFVGRRGFRKAYRPGADVYLR